MKRETFKDAILVIIKSYRRRDNRARVAIDLDTIRKQLDNLPDDMIELVARMADIYFGYNPNNEAFGNISRLFTQPLPIAQLAGFITLLANNSGGTTKSNPTAAVIAEKVFTFLIHNIYRRTDGEAIDTSGGMAAVCLGIKIGRHFLYPQVKKEGMSNVKLVILTSIDAHYSVNAAADILGIGTNNVIPIKSDHGGRMNLVDLEDKMKFYSSQEYKIIISSTMGTTVRGAIDKIKNINELRDKYPNTWHHIDGSWGALAALGPDPRQCEGIENADSVSIDLHKGFRCLLTTGVLMTKHEGLLFEANYSRDGAKYLYNSNKISLLDNGARSIECGKPDRLLGMFLVIESLKLAGLKEMIRRNYKNAEYFMKCILNCENGYFKLMNIPDYLNVCIQCSSPFDDISDSQFTEEVQEFILEQRESDVMIELCDDTVSNQKVLRCIFIQEKMNQGSIHYFLEKLIIAIDNTRAKIIDNKSKVVTN